MFQRFDFTEIVILILGFSSSTIAMDMGISCEAFWKKATFDFNTVIHDPWYILYYVSEDKVLIPSITFRVPSIAEVEKIRNFMYLVVPVPPVDWSAARLLILANDDFKITNLLVEREERGKYWEYPLPIFEIPQDYNTVLASARRRRSVHLNHDFYDLVQDEPATLHANDVRLKQTENGQVLSYMDCQKKQLLIMAKTYIFSKNLTENEIPKLALNLFRDDLSTKNVSEKSSIMQKYKKYMSFVKFFNGATVSPDALQYRESAEFEN